MDILVQTYFVVLPIIVTALMGYIVWFLQEKRKQDNIRMEEENKKREANANGTKIILFYMLQRLHTEYMYQKYVTHDQNTLFKEIYDAYHDLDGNGYGTRMWEDVKGLDIRNDVAGVSPFFELLKENKKTI